MSKYTLDLELECPSRECADTGHLLWTIFDSIEGNTRVEVLVCDYCHHVLTVIARGT